MSFRPVLSALVLIANLCCGAAILRAADGYPAHYIVFSMEEDGDVTPVFHRVVLLTSPLVSRTDEDLELLRSAPAAGDGSIEFEVRDGVGNVAYLDRMPLALWIRGEFHGPRASGGWAIDGHLFPQRDRAFVVRVPRIEGGTLSVTTDDVFRGRERTATFSLDDLAAREDLLAISQAPPTEALIAQSAISGSPSNRVDLVILGEGYTAAQAAQFQADAASLEASFFGIVPYSTYRNYVNRVFLSTTSAQSGADHPPYDPSCPSENRSCCADPRALTDPLAGTYVNTALGARFCAFNTHRSLVVDSAPTLAAASAYPDWDEILVLVNDTTYGGTGGSFAVVSRNNFAVDVARHEFGHSFTRLADEYDSPFPYPACSDISGFNRCEANVTNQTTRALIKWAPWVSASTPVPTPEGVPAYANVAGLFEGARYLTSGMYRHRDASCLMNFLGVGFGEVCSQEFVLRLYRGGWGVPSNGIDPIEPGTEKPVPGSYTSLSGATLSASLLSPIDGPPLQVTWKVNGLAVPGAQGGKFVFTTATAGTYQVALEARDATSLVHPSMAGTDLQSSRTWTLNVTPSPATSYFSLTPCRVFDTRNPIGPFGGPALAPGAIRSFNLAGSCGIPATARAIVGNLTIVQPAQGGFLAAYAGGSPAPLTSAINFAAGQVRSNITTLAVAQNGLGTVSLQSGTSGTVHVVLDVAGYYQ